MSDRSGRSRAPRRTAALVLAAALLAFAGNGCLVAETQDETYIIHPGGHRGDYVVVVHNIHSDGPTPHHQQKDFDAMVNLLKSDEYLLDRLRGGIYVKNRVVTVEKGVLVGRETGLFSEPTSVGLMRESDGTLRRRVSRNQTVTATNGRVYLEGDSVFIGWPGATREFMVITKDRTFRSTGSLVEKFQAWKAMQK